MKLTKIYFVIPLLVNDNIENRLTAFAFVQK